MALTMPKARALFDYPRYWAECFGEAPFLPMSREVGEVTSAPAMGAMFESALTGSDQRAELMQLELE